MHISIERKDILGIRADLLVVGLFAGGKRLSGPAAAVDAALGGALAKDVADLAFEAKPGEMLVLSTLGTLPATRIAVVGLGAKESCTPETLRRTAGAVVRRFRNTGIRHAALALPATALPAGLGAEALAEGALLADYQFLKHRTPPKEPKKSIEELRIVESDAARVRQAEQGIVRGRISAEAAMLARDLVNEPASIATPKHLVAHAKEIAALAPARIALEVFDRAQCQKKGMGAFLAVAAGAVEEPAFIHLTYKPARKARKKIALVGKGITFDSGGLQIKPGGAMDTMKCDMAGAAAVLGTFRALATFKPDVEVHGIIAATENMPGQKAYKPGDVVRAMNGTTIEIGHTDAEGRVTLADALSFAATLKPDLIVDLATLTGAAMVALGDELAALLTNDPKLGERLKKAAAESGERFWELPLVPEYRELIKGTFGDINNSGAGRYGGAITAGLFLQEFVGKIPWAHLDIAGPAWAERESAPYVPKGGTGFGVRTLLALLRTL